MSQDSAISGVGSEGPESPGANGAPSPTAPSPGEASGTGSGPGRGSSPVVRFLRWLVSSPRHLVVGFFMGSAEVVPGVSGGTVALVGGIYTRLIDAVRDAVNAGLTLVRGRFAEGWQRFKDLDWALLIPLGVGMVVAILSLARLIGYYLDEEPVKISGLFLGLVLGSMVVAFGLLRRVDATTLGIAAVIGVGMFLLLGLHQETQGEAGDVATAPLWAYPLAASVAICAWILPGVSGSLMLVMMGMYSDVFGAVNDRDLVPLLLFAVGAVIGLAVFSKVLAWLLENHHDRMVAAMIGLMIGSTRVLWPWPGGVDSTNLGAPRDDLVLPVVLALIGFAVVVGVGRLGLVKEEE